MASDADGSDQVTIYTYRLTDDPVTARVAPVRVTGEALPLTSDVGDRVARAVQALFDYEPRDDAASPWDDELSMWDKNDDCALAGGVRTVTVTDALIRIDLTSEGSMGRAVCTPTIPAFTMREQQFAWTVATASDSRTPVAVTIDGARNELGRDPFTADPAALDELVAVRGDAGEEGFVYQQELKSVGRVRTLAEAMAWEQEVRDGIVDQSIPVYGANGITQIDTFTLGSGTTAHDCNESGDTTVPAGR